MPLPGLRLWICAAFVLLAPEAGRAHAIPTPIPEGALRVQGSRLEDRTGQLVLLRGAHMPGLNFASPGTIERETVAAMTPLTFRIMRLRWNMNAVRLPVGVPIWQRDGERYLNQVAGIVKTANDAGLVVVLAAAEDAQAGASPDTGLPSPTALSFWRAWAAFFKDNPKVVFSLFQQPSSRNVPGRVAGRRLPLEWQFWLRGGTTTTGRQAVGMQDLVDAIRSTGATQVIAAPAFHDEFGFQEFGSEFYLRDANIIYEMHPYFDVALTNAEREAKFGFLAGRFPLYAGEWGLTLLEDQPGCRRFPRDILQGSDAIYQTLGYFDSQGISWTASGFQPRRLIQDFVTYEATRLDRLWTCGQPQDPQPGMGQFVILWLTGDSAGFGTISPTQIASAAGGAIAAVAPGQIISIFSFLFGPESETLGHLDASGLLSSLVGETRVLFDGTPGPIFLTGPFLINVQVPYSVAGKTSTTIQVFYQDVPSNAIKVPVAEAAPEIFTGLGTSAALALNQDGSINSSINPAAPNTVVVVFATGVGETTPPGVTGKPAQQPFARPALSVSLTIGGSPAEILYTGETPGFVGLVQINARVPPPLIPPGGGVSALPIVLTVGSQRSRGTANLWVR